MSNVGVAPKSSRAVGWGGPDPTVDGTASWWAANIRNPPEYSDIYTMLRGFRLWVIWVLWVCKWAPVVINLTVYQINPKIKCMRGGYCYKVYV